MESAQSTINQILPTDSKSVEDGMSSDGADFLKGYPKPHSDPGVLQHLQGLSAQQEEVNEQELAPAAGVPAAAQSCSAC